MKELPYFRFTPSEWQNGKISLEDYDIQGFFLNVCSYYWISDCSITLAMLEKKYKHDKDLIKECLELEIFHHDEASDFISISFLNDQFDTLSEARKRRQEAGYKGGTNKSKNSSKAKAMLEQCPSYKDKDKDKDKDKRERVENLTPEKKIFIIPILEIENYMLSDQMWVETICMQNHFSESELKQKIKEFVEKLRAENIKEKHKNDLFSHFSNWINNKNYAKTRGAVGYTADKIKSGAEGSYAAKRPIKSAL